MSDRTTSTLSHAPTRGRPRRGRRRLFGVTLVAALVAPLIAVAAAQPFPPFPDPAPGPFPDTEKLNFEAQLLPAEINAVTDRGGVLLNDIWGWTSPAGEEYALIGTGDGMSIVRVTDPANPEFLGQLPTPSMFANLWGDVATYDTPSGSFAYFVTEADGTGVQILDLDQLDALPPAANTSVQIPATAIWEEGGYESAHNIYINQASGFAYIAGVGLVSEGPTACDGEDFHPSRFNAFILDLRSDPTDPTIARCVADAAEHDFYVVNYNGVDKDYKGREIAFVFDGRDKDAPSRRGQRTDDTPDVLGGGTTEIWDVTDKANIDVVASFTAPGICFSHQGWTSDSRHQFLLINDEVDELRDLEPAGGFFRSQFCDTEIPGGTVSNPGMYVMNIRDLDAPVFQERFEIDSPGDNDHNVHRRGNKMFWAAYSAGTRVIKMQIKGGPNAPLQLSEFAVLDSEPRPGAGFFNGQWGIYAFPDSDTVVASDIRNGLIVMTL